MGKLTVPFSFSGYVEIECTQEEYEARDASPLYQRAQDELQFVELLNELDFDGFDMVDAEYSDEEE